MCCVVLYCFVLYCFVLYCIVLYCNVLYYYVMLWNLYMCTWWNTSTPTTRASLPGVKLACLAYTDDQSGWPKVLEGLIWWVFMWGSPKWIYSYFMENTIKMDAKMGYPHFRNFPYFFGHFDNFIIYQSGISWLAVRIASPETFNRFPSWSMWSATLGAHLPFFFLF